MFLEKQINKKFSPHGSIEISLEDNIVVMDIEGPCNTEFFQEMVEKLAKVRDKINLNNYTGLVILHGEALASEDAMLYFTNYLKTVSPKAVALNLQYAESPSLTEPLCRKAYSAANIKHAFFMSTDEAKIWLRQCMD